MKSKWAFFCKVCEHNCMYNVHIMNNSPFSHTKINCTITISCSYNVEYKQLQYPQKTSIQDNLTLCTSQSYELLSVSKIALSIWNTPQGPICSSCLGTRSRSSLTPRTRPRRPSSPSRPPASSWSHRINQLARKYTISSEGNAQWLTVEMSEA